MSEFRPIMSAVFLTLTVSVIGALYGEPLLFSEKAELFALWLMFFKLRQIR